MNSYDNKDDSYKPKNDEEEFMYFINVDESVDDASRKNDILDITPNKLQNTISHSLQSYHTIFCQFNLVNPEPLCSEYNVFLQTNI